MKTIPQTNHSTLRARNVIDVFSAENTVSELKSAYARNEITLGMYYLALYEMMVFAWSFQKGSEVGEQANILHSMDPKAAECFCRRRIVFDCLINGAYNDLFGRDIEWFAECYEGEAPMSQERIIPFLKANGLSFLQGMVFAK